MQTSKLLSAVLMLLVTQFMTGCAPKKLLVSWTEEVKLLDGKTIQVQRTDEFEGTAYNGSESGPAWQRQTILIPRPSGRGPPIKWESVWISANPDKTHTPQQVVARALYFEGDNPNIVTTDIGNAVGLYGCVYTNDHRLWVWSDALGWTYDPRSRLHTKYVGLPNLQFNSKDPSVTDTRTLANQQAHPNVFRIDTRHEPALCPLTPSDAKYSFKELTSESGS